MTNSFGMFRKGDSFSFARVSRKQRTYVEAIALDATKQEFVTHRIPKQYITSITPHKGEHQT